MANLRIGVGSVLERRDHEMVIVTRRWWHRLPRCLRRPVEWIRRKVLRRHPQTLVVGECEGTITIEGW